MARTNKYTEARRKKGITTPYGQWLYPGKVTTIPDNKITMQGVPYPVLGISDKGDTKMMLPGMDYLFKGNEVTEYPLIGKAQFGNWLKETARKIIDSEARNAPSYSKDEISFANAFNDARNKGANKFYWDGKYYNTVKKEELDENNELKKDVYFPSYNIREKIKEFEGYKPNVYLDGNGIETIGYGFTDKDIVNKYRDTGITREAAEEIFNDYINSFVGELKGTPHFDELNQNQRDALLSYIYNIGSTNYFENSDLMQGALRDRNWEEVARQMDYGYNDKNNTGLRKRRDYEQKLFLTPVKQEGGYAPSYFLANQQMNVNKPDTASTSGIYASKWPTRDTAIANGVANGSSQQAFYEDMFHSLTDYMKEHGIEENVGRPTAYNIIAHHAMESSSGGRLPAAFNYGGIRLPGSTNYKKFDGIDNFIKDYMENTIGGRSVFEQAANGNAMSFEDYMKTLKNNGYFEADLDTYTRNAKNDGYMRAKRFLDDIPYQTGGEIHIKEKNRGKFTEAAKRAGKSVQAYAAQILANKENYSPTLVKRANFARNAAKFKHQEGGVPFEEWYKTVPTEKNDTTNYDLRTAYQYLPYSDMVKFANDKNFHLGSVVEMPGGDYVFLKRKDHPTIQKELDWYYGNTPEAKEFRNNYTLDTSGEYYRYVPKKHQIGKYQSKGIVDKAKEALRSFKAGFTRDSDVRSEPLKPYNSDDFKRDVEQMIKPVNQYKKDHPWFNPVYNGINLGLYAAAPFTDGLTLPFAYAMSGIDAGAGAADAYVNGLNVDNGLSIAGGLPVFKLPKTLSFGVKLKPQTIRLLQPYSYTGKTKEIQQFLKSHNVPELQKKFAQYYWRKEAANVGLNGGDDAIELINDYTNKKQSGGIGKYLEGNYVQPNTIGSVMGAWNDQLAKGIAKGDTIANHIGTALNTADTAVSSVASQWGAATLQDNPNAAPLFWDFGTQIPTVPETKQFEALTDGQSEANRYPINPNKIDTTGYDNWQKQMIYSKPYFQKGGLSSIPAEIERGEIVSTPTGDSIANGLMDYHELYDNQNEKKKNIVNLTNNMVKDVLHNPQLSSINERVNKYTAMRRNGKTFIFPSTVGTNGEILEPQVGANYWLAKLINKK